MLLCFFAELWSFICTIFWCVVLTTVGIIALMIYWENLKDKHREERQYYVNRKRSEHENDHEEEYDGEKEEYLNRLKKYRPEYERLHSDMDKLDEEKVIVLEEKLDDLDEEYDFKWDWFDYITRDSSDFVGCNIG